MGESAVHDIAAQYRPARPTAGDRRSAPCRDALPFAPGGTMPNAETDNARDYANRAPFLDSWRKMGVWRDLTLGQAMAQTAARNPDAPLVLHSDSHPATILTRDIHR